MSEGGRPPLTAKKKWTAITVSTLLLMVSYWFVMFAVVASSIDEAPEPGPAVALGLALVPFVFLLLAFMSQNPNAPSATLKAMGFAIVVGVPIVTFLDPVSGLAAGFGAGGIAALAAEEAHTAKSRWLAVAAVVVYLIVLVRVLPEIALIFGPLLPFPALGIADAYAEYRADERQRRAAA